MIPIYLDFRIRQVLIEAARMTALTDAQKEELIVRIICRLKNAESKEYTNEKGL